MVIETRLRRQAWRKSSSRISHAGSPRSVGGKKDRRIARNLISASAHEAKSGEIVTVTAVATACTEVGSSLTGWRCKCRFTFSAILLARPAGPVEREVFLVTRNGFLCNLHLLTLEGDLGRDLTN